MRPPRILFVSARSSEHIPRLHVSVRLKSGAKRSKFEYLIYLFVNSPSTPSSFCYNSTNSSSFSMIKGAFGSYNIVLTYLVCRTVQGIACKYALDQQLAAVCCCLRPLHVHIAPMRPRSPIPMLMVRISSKFCSKRLTFNQLIRYFPIRRP